MACLIIPQACVRLRGVLRSVYRKACEVGVGGSDQRVTVGFAARQQEVRARTATKLRRTKETGVPSQS